MMAPPAAGSRFRRPVRSWRRWAGALAIGLGAALEAGAGVREWEIKSDPPAAGRQIITVRLTPSETAAYDVLLFECALRQEYTRRDSSGAERRRVVEPAVFTYRERDVKMVRDLDCHVSFRVPVGVAEARAAFGNTLFVDDAPVTISRIRIVALRDGKRVWSVASPAAGLHRPAARETP
jgi:hypothetical protein